VTASPRWTPARAIAAAFAVGWLTIQGLLPLTQLAAGGSKPFAWQMFSRERDRPRFTAVSADGSEREVDWERYVGGVRSEVDLLRHLPPHLCRRLPDAVAIATYRSEVSGQPAGRRTCP
jgi:hypothetical protein